MVDASLGQACRKFERAIKAEIARLDWEIASANAAERNALEKQRDKLATGFDDRVLTLRGTSDRANGIWSFLIRACQYLAEEIATNPYTGDPEAEERPAWRGVDCFLEAARRRELPLWG